MLAKSGSWASASSFFWTPLVGICMVKGSLVHDTFSRSGAADRKQTNLKSRRVPFHGCGHESVREGKLVARMGESNERSSRQDDKSTAAAAREKSTEHSGSGRCGAGEGSGG
ncbi:hypothetical protein K440DRAFT_629852 [Wilcoxina mikolae CBS 423.85]|nr:hypothetical protein K440DRAFT_629852 [Wilcoxina mikolae CBS 423.85]